MEYAYYFETGKHEYDQDSDDWGNPLYKVQILNNVKTDPGFVFTSRGTCEFCLREHKENCDFSMRDKKKKLKDIAKMMDDDRDLKLVVHWRQNPKANLQQLEKPIVIDIKLPCA